MERVDLRKAREALLYLQKAIPNCSYKLTHELTAETLAHIIEALDPPKAEPFDWGTVRAGQAFQHPMSGEIWLYVGPNLSKHGFSSCSKVFTNKETGKYNWFGMAMTRAPEHDIEVKL